MDLEGSAVLHCAWFSALGSKRTNGDAHRVWVDFGTPLELHTQQLMIMHFFFMPIAVIIMDSGLPGIGVELLYASDSGIQGLK